ncbi:MAG: hypothetical protein ABEI58_01530 [Candidatus Nanohaloarchaea archaeon]
MDKLVRDRIPEIIRENGEEPITEQVEDQEVLPYLVDKVEEEAEEFVESQEIEELADLLEVIERFLELEGASREELERLKEKKNEERGGFEDNIILKDVVE